MDVSRQLNHVPFELQANQLLWNRKNLLSKFSIAIVALTFYIWAQGTREFIFRRTNCILIT